MLHAKARSPFGSGAVPDSTASAYSLVPHSDVEELQQICAQLRQICSLHCRKSIELFLSSFSGGRFRGQQSWSSVEELERSGAAPQRTAGWKLPRITALVSDKESSWKLSKAAAGFRIQLSLLSHHSSWGSPQACYPTPTLLNGKKKCTLEAGAPVFFGGGVACPFSPPQRLLRPFTPPSPSSVLGEGSEFSKALGSEGSERSSVA